MKRTKMERKLLKSIFNSTERNVIFNALCYSCHKYKQHGQIDEAVKVQSVINRVYDAFGMQNVKFTKEEVDSIVEDTMKRTAEHAEKLFTNKIKQAHRAGYQEALKNVSAGIAVVFNSRKDDNEEQKPTDENEKPENENNKGENTEKENENKEE